MKNKTNNFTPFLGCGLILLILAIPNLLIANRLYFYANNLPPKNIDPIEAGIWGMTIEITDIFILTKAAYKNDGELTREDEIKLVTHFRNPNRAKDSIYKIFHEPFSQLELEQLEALMESTQDQQLKFNCAALLYRYNIPAGEAYLSKELHANHSIASAEIFGMNKLDQHAPKIMEVLLKRYPPPSGPSMGPLSLKNDLLEIVGPWQNPHIADGFQGLQEQLLRQKRPVGMGLLAINMAQQESLRHEAIPLLITSLNATRGKFSISRYAIHLDLLLPTQQVYETIIIDELNIPFTEKYWSIQAIEALRFDKSARSVQLLQSYIRKTLGEPIPIENRFIHSRQQALRAAILSLAYVDEAMSPETIQLIADAMQVELSTRTTPEKEQTILYYPEVNNVRMGLAHLIDHQVIDNHPDLKILIGEEYLARATATQNLPKLPEKYLPRSSQVLNNRPY